MLWNELSYENQLKVISLIEDALLEQTDELMQDGLIAAITELETWSNSPCETMSAQPLIALAQFEDVDAEWDKIASFLKD